MDTSENNEFRSYLDWALKGRAKWWLYIIGVFLLWLTLAVINPILRQLISVILGGFTAESPALNIIVVHLSFIFVFLVPPLLVRVLHSRPSWSVALPRPMFKGWNLGMGFLFGLLTNLIIYAIYALFFGVNITFEAPELGVYLPFVVAAFLAFFIQTSAEEMVFRGYFMQTIRRFTANPVILVLSVGLIFGLMHYGNLATFGWPWYGVVLWMVDGALLAWLAYRSRSLWMPLGWHWANNFGLIVLIDAKAGDVVQGMPLFIADQYPAINYVIITKVVVILVLGLSITWLIKRRENTPAA